MNSMMMIMMAVITLVGLAECIEPSSSQCIHGGHRFT